MVIRIMVMVPLYAISSFISLFSLEAGVVIDVIRDVYEVRFVADMNFGVDICNDTGICYLLLLPPIAHLPWRGAFVVDPTLRP